MMMENDNHGFCTASKDVSSSSIGGTSTKDSQEKTLANTNTAEASLSVDHIGCNDNSTAEDVSSATSPVKENKIASSLFRKEYVEKKLVEHYRKSYPTPIIDEDVFHRCVYHKVIQKKIFGPHILGFGLENFMSYAAHFCRYEARNGAEIISVGCGDGTVDSEIIATYRQHFAEEIKITLVDPNPDYKVDFKTVADLIAERPHVVSNCILFIIWPEPMGRNDGYDIDAVHKLQPLAALTLYEPTEVSGSAEFTEFLCIKTKEDAGCTSCWYNYNGDSATESRLDNYIVEKVASQDVCGKAGVEFELFGRKMISEPATSFQRLRMLKLKRKQ